MTLATTLAAELVDLGTRLTGPAQRPLRDRLSGLERLQHAPHAAPSSGLCRVRSACSGATTIAA
jgi:hypothetical protein